MSARARCLAGLAFALLALAGCGPSSDADGARGSASGRRPNVVLVSVDTLRPDRLSAYGHARPTSPRLEALAAEGVLFESAWAQAPCTAPSHMALMTGLYPEAHGVQQWRPGPNLRLQDDVPTLARLLAAEGWRAEAYTGGGNVRPELGFDGGFEVYESHPHVVEPIFDRALAAVERLAAGPEPFFLFVHTFGVHDPYFPPDEQFARFAEPGYAGRIEHRPEALGVADTENWKDRSKAFWERVDPDSPADLARLQQLYDACIAHVDANLGRLVDRLEQLGLRDDTLIVFTADHGEEFLEHGGFKHNTIYDELLRVPLVLVPPAGAPVVRGTRVQGAVRLVDVLPTLLELLGLPPLERTHGRSLLASLGGVELRPEPLHAQWLRGKLHTLRVDQHKLIFKHTVPPRFELYDLSVDPGEQHDLARAQPERVLELMDRLRGLRERSREVYGAYGSGGVVELDDAVRTNLEALGYLGR